MKRENISDALGLLDDGMIRHTIMVRRKKAGKQKNIRKAAYAIAACLCLACAGVAAAWTVFHNGPGIEPPEEEILSGGQEVQENSDGDMPEKFVEIASLLAPGEGNFSAEQALEIAAVPIGQYMGNYTKTPSADSSVLASSLGKSVGSSGEWYAVCGHLDLQYLIRKDGQGYSLWKFQCFDSSKYPYSDVLALVYQIDSADGIAEIKVLPARMDNTDGGEKIQEEIGVRTVTDRGAIETMYEVLSGMACYGSDRWDMIDYGDVEAASDGGTKGHEAVRLGRYLSITTAYGNVIDGLKYTAVSGMFYEFSGIAYDRLPKEQAESICEIIGIADPEGKAQKSCDMETDQVSREDGI